MTLEARALDFGFRGHEVGRSLDLALATAHVACLLGPNGSGKTTLLRTLLGVLPPLGGEVLLEGRTLSSWAPRRRAMRLAYVPQAAESQLDFSVLETALMGRTPHGGIFSRPGAADRERAFAALERLGIAPLAHRPIHRVSGGERQLALIARALATEATHLLMDEPTANLDFGNQAMVLEEIARLGAAGAGVLFSTHHPEHALRVADRAILLKAGTVLRSGTPAQVVTAASLSELYGRPITHLPAHFA
jgi:iron complex transport system ATP-binding protein